MDYTKLNIYRAIKGPVRTKLHEMLKLLKKDDLMSFAGDFAIKGRSKMNKEKLAEKLYSRFLNPGYLEDTLLVATKEELSLFRMLLEDTFSEKGEVAYGKLRYLTEMGIVFLFQQEGTIYMVVPEEMKQSYRLIDQDNFAQRHKRIEEIHQYILAMTNLYGAFSSNLPFEVYNRQNSKQINNQEYIDIIFRLEMRQQYFYIYFNNIISEYFEMPEMEEELALMLRERKGKPYYIPKKNVLLKYADNSYEEEIPEYLALKDFIYNDLNLESKKAEFLMDDISIACSMGDSINSIMDDVNRREAVFEGIEQVNEFLRLVTELSNNSRLWINKGHTPREIFEKYEKPKLQPLPDEPFEMNTQQMHSDKIGRNDPCPCGSGKKYKKCCGDLS